MRPILLLCVTAATAADMPVDAASKGVIMLPMPKPTTAAVAPDSTPTRKMTTSNIARAPSYDKRDVIAAATSANRSVIGSNRR